MQRLNICSLTITIACALELIFAATMKVAAQTPEYYNTRQGLPSTRISKILFDENNFLWVATDLGLSRFNGTSFINYQAVEGEEHSLQQNRVNSLFVAKDKSHWISASDGLYYLCRTQNSMTRYPVFGDQVNVSVGEIEQHPLRHHTIVMSTYGYGFQYFDTENRTFDHAATDSLTALIGVQNAPHFHIDSQCRLWAFKDKWISVVDLRTMKVVKIKSPIPSGEQENIQVKNAVEDCSGGYIYMATLKHGVLVADLRTMEVQYMPIPVRNTNALALSPDCKLVVGTECEGLWIYDPETLMYDKITASGSIDLNHAKVQNLCFDAYENLWLGIYQQGLMMLPGPNTIFTCQPVSPSLSDSRNLGCVSSFATMSDGSRAYGLDGQGLVVDWQNGERSHYNSNNSLMTNSAIVSLQPVSDGRLFIATYQGGIYSLDKDRKIRRIDALSSLNHSYIRTLAYDKQGQIIYIGINGGGVYEYNIEKDKLQKIETQNNRSVTWINSLFISKQRRLWIADPLVVHYLDTKKNELITPKQGIGVTSGHCFAEDEEGTIWIASNKGILKYDEALDSIIQVHEEVKDKQLEYASVFCSEGKLWLSSTGCITCFDPKNGQFTHYKDKNIANIGTMSDCAVQQWSDSTIWFGGDNGALAFLPSKVLHSNRVPSPLLLQQLWVDNIPTDYDPSLSKEENVLDASLWCATTLRLPHDRSFAITYSHRDANSSFGYSYSHRLRNYENDWHLMHSDATTASYQSLPSGNYVLEIQATPNLDNPNGETLKYELNVIILPPWYATWWAIILWIVLSAALIGYSTKEVTDRRREKKALLEAERTRKAKEERLDLLTSVSHEIKTPLTLIISPLRKLMERKSEPAMQSVLDMMYRNSLRILMLVNQQMDVRKMDHGQLLLHVKELPLRTFLDDMMQYFSNTALSHHINYRLELPEPDDEEATIWADPQQLDKVLLNLLSNAFKFVPNKGDVIISVSDSTLPDGKEATRISVYNSGSHLTPDEQPKAFTGIGLSIARELTQLHHGTLTVRNLQEGVAFDIELLKGNSHYTAEQLAKAEEGTTIVKREELAKINEDLREKSEQLGEGDEEEQQKERELIEQLSDELREKQRLRERRQTLDINYAEIQMSSADEKLMRRVTDVIHKNMANSDFSVETLSNEVGISRVHLNRKLKELVDTSPSALIRSIRLKQAAFLLIQSNVTVAEVAYAVGFSSPAYFSSNFSQFFGMTPKEFTSNFTENPDSPELKQLLNQ